MKKKRFFVAGLVLALMLSFAGCGNNDANDNGINDGNENSVVEDTKDAADDIGDDIEDGAKDLAGDENDNKTPTEKEKTDENVKGE